MPSIWRASGDNVRRALLVNLSMLAATMSLVFWIGWKVPTDSRPAADLPDVVSESSVDGAPSMALSRAAAIDASMRPSEAAIPSPVLTAPSATPASHAGSLDLNRAGVDDLQRLPGIGPALAARVVEFRRLHGPLATVDDLLQVKGIGQKRLDRLRGQVMVGRSTPREQGGRL